jgi:hypothetical protein
MSLLGTIFSTQDLNLDGGAVSNFLTLAAPVSTTAAALENIGGFTFNISLTETGRIVAFMIVEAKAAGDAVGAWAISIDGTDYGEIGQTLKKMTLKLSQ